MLAPLKYLIFVFTLTTSISVQAADAVAEILDAVRECAIRESITADDGHSPVETTTDSVRVLCSITSSRLYSLYDRSGWLSSDSGKASLKEQQENARKIIGNVVLVHREKLILRRNGDLGDEMKRSQSIVKQCATTNAPMADDYVSDAKTIALNLAAMCSQEYEKYIDAYAVMTFEDESQRSKFKRSMLAADKKSEIFLTPVISNRKTHQSLRQAPTGMPSQR